MKELLKKNEDLLKLISERDQEILYLKEQIELLKRMIFASKKEKFISDPEGMRPLFEEEVSSDTKKEEAVEEETEVRGYKRRGKRKPIPANIPRVRQEFDLPEEQKICTEHNVPLEKIGEESVDKLDIVPAKMQVLEQVTFTYKCPCCENNFVKSQRDPDPIPKSVASPGLLAHIVTGKYVDALPLHRQEKIFLRHNVHLDRTTMARWVIACANLAIPLLNLMMEALLDSEAIHADETSLQVLREKHRKAEQKSYIWALARSGQLPIVLYKYYENRSKKSATDLLDTYSGTVIADGYNVYEKVAESINFTLAGCMAHCRRRFFEAHKISKKEGMPGKKSGGLAETGLSFIKALYKIEREIKEDTPEKKLEVRKEKSVPILEEFHTWLLATASIVLPKSYIGKAVNYALNQWEKLIVFSTNGSISIDNNFIESKIRPFVIGRNNWMFSTSPEGAHASAALYSLVESAKSNNLDPYSYLRLIFKELPKAQSIEDYEKLLPYKVRDHFDLKAYTIPP
jgi:transposase